MARLDPLAFAATLPCWGGRVSPVPLAGGLTNDNFVVEDGGRRYVVRVGGDIPAGSVRANSGAACGRASFQDMSNPFRYFNSSPRKSSVWS